MGRPKKVQVLDNVASTMFPNAEAKTRKKRVLKAVPVIAAATKKKPKAKVPKSVQRALSGALDRLAIVTKFMAAQA